MTSRTAMELEDELRLWAEKFYLEESTMKALLDKGFTSAALIGNLPQQHIDRHFPQLSPAQNVTLGKGVHWLKTKKDESSRLPASYGASTAIANPQPSTSGVKRRVRDDSSDGKMARYESMGSVTGVSGGHMKGSCAAGINYGSMHVTNEESRNGTLGKKSLDLKITTAQKKFFETENYRKIAEKLREHGRITICGASGEGKTTMSLMLASQYQEQGYGIVFVDSIELFDLEKYIDSRPRLFLIIDDIFGIELNSAHMATTKRCLDDLYSYTEHCREHSEERQDIGAQSKSRRKNNHVNEDMITQQQSKRGILIVFTSKTYHFEEAVSHMLYHRFGLFREETIIDVTKNPLYRYSQNDKRAILNLYHKDGGDIENILNKECNLFGFPLTCRLFYDILVPTVDALKFFRQPLICLRIELNELLNRKDDMSAVLILMFLFEDKLDLQKLQSPHNDIKYKKAMESLSQFDESLTRSHTGMYRQAKMLKGTYFVGGDTVSFAHASLYDACALEVFQLNPTFVIEQCSDRFLYERLKPEIVHEANIDAGSHEISVSKNYIMVIAERFAKALRQRRFVYSVTHSILKDDQLYSEVLKKLIKDDDREKVSEESKLAWIHEKDQGKCFLYWASIGHRPKIIQDIDETLPSHCKFTISEITEGVDGCIQKDNLIILKLLMSKTSTEQPRKNDILLQAAKYGSIEVANYILSENANPNSKCPKKKQNMLHVACKSGQSDFIGKIISDTIATSLVNMKDIKGKTPIMIAALTGNEECFKLLKPLSDLSMRDEDWNGMIHLGCLGENKHIVDCLLLSSNINSRGMKGRTPIMIVVTRGNQDLFEYLHSKNADLSIEDYDGNSLLHLACLNGQKDIADTLLTLTPNNINRRDEKGYTPLMISAYNGHQHLFEYLLQKQTDAMDSDTLLHLACLGGNKTIVEKLLPKSNIDSKRMDGRTPVMLAAWIGDEKLFHFLVSKGADLISVDKYNMQVIHLAAIGGNKSIVHSLLSYFKIDVKGPNDKTPAMLAAFMGRQTVFDLLVSKHADLKLDDGFGNVFLHLACKGGNTSIVKCLLSKFNKNKIGERGWTPIMMAALKGHEEVFNLLKSENVEVDFKDKFGDSLLHLACKGGILAIVQSLLTQKNKDSKGQHGWTPVMITALKGHKKIFDFLVSKNVNLALFDKFDNSLIHLACKGGNIAMVHSLLSEQSNINIRGQKGWTPVMSAVLRPGGQQGVFDYLVANAADLNLVDYDDNTLLHLASKGGNKAIVQHLLPSFDIDIRGQNGKTPVMVAAENGNGRAFDLLVANNADLKMVDDDDNTLIELACKDGDRYIMNRLQFELTSESSSTEETEDEEVDSDIEDKEDSEDEEVDSDVEDKEDSEDEDNIRWLV